MIKTGKEPLPVLTFIAILAVCFIINLPGVAVAPIEGKLKGILHTSELEIQLLTTLPNFVIIPFVILAGKLSDYKYKMPLIVAALVLFVASGVIYLFTGSMTGLIVASCLLGVSDGILIPFAMGFVVNSFVGKYRTRNLGFKSATSNFGTVVAGFFIGFIINEPNWHLPFIIYLVAIIPLILCYWLKYIPGFGDIPLAPTVNQAEDLKKGGKDINYKRIWALVFNNVFITFITFAIILFFPQLIQQYGWSATISGDIMAVFFIAVLSSGFFLEIFIKTFKSFSFLMIGTLVAAGFAFIVFLKAEWAMYVGCILAGIAFGFVQPLIYDKTSYAVINPKKNIFGLSLVLCALYIGIAVQPFIISGICSGFRLSDENIFAFHLSFYLAIAYMVIAFLFRKKFGFSIEPSYYS